jgi:enoyl-CoA hydratase
MADFIQIDADEHGSTHVVLNRSPANAFNEQVVEELSQVAGHLAASSARVVLLRSAQPIFMAGADLNDVNVSWNKIRERVGRFQSVLNDWERLPMPTIALINGHALGGGCELALTCDWRIMARGQGRIGLPEVRRGLLPAGGGTQRTARLVGLTAARDLAMRGLTLDADEAKRIGLVSEACEAEELMQRGLALARELIALPGMALAAVKRCILEALDTDIESGLAIEQREQQQLADTADAREGVAAFVEKRDPVWLHR